MLAALAEREKLLANSETTPTALEKLRKNFERQILAALPGIEIIGADALRLWNTVSVIMPEADCRQRAVVKLDKAGFAVSTGSACASGKEKPSHVLTAMGFPSAAAARALRISGGPQTTAEDWARLARALADVANSAAR